MTAGRPSRQRWYDTNGEPSQSSIYIHPTSSTQTVTDAHPSLQHSSDRNGGTHTPKDSSPEELVPVHPFLKKYHDRRPYQDEKHSMEVPPRSTSRLHDYGSNKSVSQASLLGAQHQHRRIYGENASDRALSEKASFHTSISFNASQETSFDNSMNSSRKQRALGRGQAKKQKKAKKPTDPGKKKKGFRFWVIMAAMMVVALLGALDMTMISTALPSIIAELPVSSISGAWITSAYLLTMTASQPAFGGLSCVIGRRWSMLLGLGLFLLGSLICALAPTLLGLVMGRGVQGLGGGGVHALCEIITSDMTTLKERGLYFGLIGLVFAAATFGAPVLGGVFSGHLWRWIFWINLPIGAVALVLIFLFLHIRVPPMPLKEKVQRMDLAGNVVLAGSVVGILIAVTEAGIVAPWSSPKIYVPLIAGLIGFTAFLCMEFIPNPLCRQPILPLDIFKNRTAAASFFQTFVHGMVCYGAIYMMPIYFQAIHAASALRSAILSFPITAPSAPFAIVAGAVISLSGKYKEVTFVAWALMSVGFGWITVFGVSTPLWEQVIPQMLAGMGLGMLATVTLPPIQASLPVERIEAATATYAFTRTFGAVWGITLATSIFNADVAGKVRGVQEFAQVGLTEYTALGYVESVKKLPQPLQDRALDIYAAALRKSFWVFVPMSIVGFFAVFALKALPLPDQIQSQADFDDGNGYTEKSELPTSHSDQSSSGADTLASHSAGAREKLFPMQDLSSPSVADFDRMVTRPPRARAHGQARSFYKEQTYGPQSQRSLNGHTLANNSAASLKIFVSEPQDQTTPTQPHYSRQNLDVPNSPFAENHALSHRLSVLSAEQSETHSTSYHSFVNDMDDYDGETDMDDDADWPSSPSAAGQGRIVEAWSRARAPSPVGFPTHSPSSARFSHRSSSNNSRSRSSSNVPRTRTSSNPRARSNSTTSDTPSDYGSSRRSRSRM